LYEVEVVEDVTEIPRIASLRLAAGALRSQRRLLNELTVVPPERRMPLTAGDVVEIAPLSEMSKILFFEIFTFVPLLTDSPLTTGDVAPEPEIVFIVFPLTLTVAPPVICMPADVTLAPVDDSPLIALLAIDIVVTEVAASLRPTTAPPVPVEDNPEMILFDIDSEVALPLLPRTIPLIAPCPVMFEMVFPVTF
jgi:hypothetical protein